MGAMEQNASVKNKAGSNAIVTHSYMKRNIPGGLSFAINLWYSTHSINPQADCGYQVHGTERKISHLLCMDDLKLLGRSKNNLEN